MQHYTLIVVGDERSPVRRIQVPVTLVRRAVWIGAAVALFLALAVFDYTRMRIDNGELAGLRVEVAEQRDQIQLFETTLANVQSELGRVREFERKARIIANLPGSVATGGEGVAELVPEGSADQPVVMPPAGVPMTVPQGQGGDAEDWGGLEGASSALGSGFATEGAQKVALMRSQANQLSGLAGQRADSLVELVDQLEGKRHRLQSTPSIWPTKGWMTSRYGPRISPFTGRRQFHAGIDVAAATGAPIIAPARGRVTFVGYKGPLGKSVVVDHGFGVRTVYGHAHVIHVKIGDEVQRGQLLAEVGNTGRSTGPHLHYAVQVKGKARNPLDYIFD